MSPLPPLNPPCAHSGPPLLPRGRLQPAAWLRLASIHRSSLNSQEIRDSAVDPRCFRRSERPASIRRYPARGPGIQSAHHRASGDTRPTSVWYPVRTAWSSARPLIRSSSFRGSEHHASIPHPGPKAAQDRLSPAFFRGRKRSALHLSSIAQPLSPMALAAALSPHSAVPSFPCGKYSFSSCFRLRSPHATIRRSRGQQAPGITR